MKLVFFDLLLCVQRFVLINFALRQAMIGVTSCLAAEFARGVGLKEQIGEAPVRAILVSKAFCQVFVFAAGLLCYIA